MIAAGSGRRVQMSLAGIGLHLASTAATDATLAASYQSLAQRRANVGTRVLASNSSHHSQAGLPRPTTLSRSKMSSKRSQPQWDLPASTQKVSPLQIFNSLTRSKNEFVPLTGGRVNWYNCGPTVYDSSHMGHARSYITFDIIRRILRDYFNFDVFFVQNVTDIDDKIIHRARQNHLYDDYVSQLAKKDRQAVLDDAKTALALIEQKLADESDPDKRDMLSKMVKSAQAAISNTTTESTELVAQIKDILSIWLDKEYGKDVTDNNILKGTCTSLSRHFENEYNLDMKALNILPPDCITRVSEFVPEIVEYVKKIIGNGYAYVSNGSVYFETEKFANTQKQFYAKLVPEAYGDNKALTEGEGDLVASEEEKRSPKDFALWKNSKPGEPSWPSPWGNGRPGWHIECSVMASALFGGQMDIHSGGVDLRFPHHDNEMAQAEAYFNTARPWVNYFLHSGHLTISGCKMSKSLKNFITIREALEKNSARQLRIAFLLHSWKDTLDYSENTMNDAIQFEKTVNEFFLTVKDILRTHQQLPVEQKIVKWTESEINLNQRFKGHIESVDQALRDNIDTKTACDEIRRLITAANVYIQEKQNVSNPNLLHSIARYMTRILDIFGCVSFGDPIGFPLDSSSSNGDREQEIYPFLEVIKTLREEIRSKARELKSKDLFVLCDSIRDDILPNLGVRMEDYETESGLMTRLKLVDRDILLKEREEKLKLNQLRQQEKESKKITAQPKATQPPVPPSELFRKEVGKYSQFDENGKPTHDHEGKELSKSALKKVEKLYQAQEKKYNDYLKTNEAIPKK